MNATPSPAPPAPPRPTPPTADDTTPEARRCAALQAARELSEAVHRLTRHPTCGEGTRLAAALRHFAGAVERGLEEGVGSPSRLTGSLRSLWRTGDLIDAAERKGHLEMGDAVELLALGSRVEIPLVLCLRQGGTRPV